MTDDKEVIPLCQPTNEGNTNRKSHLTWQSVIDTEISDEFWIVLVS